MSTDTADLDAFLVRFQAAESEEEVDALLKEAARTFPRTVLARHIDLLRTRHAEAVAGFAGATSKLALVKMANYEQTASSEPFRPTVGSEVALRVFEILHRLGREALPDPADTLDEGDSAHLDTYQSSLASLAVHLASAAYYVLDAEPSHAAIASEPPQQETFPPLPFPRVWIEMAHMVPYAVFRSKDDDDPEPAAILGVAVAEVERGRVWDVFIPYEFIGRPAAGLAAQLLSLRIRPDGVVIPDPGLGDLSEAAFAPVRQLVVSGVHLITARNVPSSEVTLPRPQRRRLAREHEAFAVSGLPRIYFVDLAAAGEHASDGGSREFHVRWLVRGHWRHIASGRSFCTCCDPPQIASWVDPYIKGPVGAPWKGRQVRRT